MVALVYLMPHFCDLTLPYADLCYLYVALCAACVFYAHLGYLLYMLMFRMFV